MGIRAFLKSKAFFRHFAYMFLLSIVLIAAVQLSLRFYTHHGHSISVPEFIGAHDNEIKTLCKQNKLRYSIIDSTFVPGTSPGSVIDQYPKAGYRVKSGRMIFLTIAALSPEKVKVPKLIDVSLREAQSRLQNAGLTMGIIEYRPSEFSNLVLDQKYLGLTISSGTEVIKGSAIDLVVGTGLSNEKAQIPNLFGLTIAEARLQLYHVGLNLGATIEDGSLAGSIDQSLARIYKQKPTPDNGNTIEVGASVDIWITTDSTKFVSTEGLEENADSTGGL